MGRERKANSPVLSLDEQRAFQALYQPSLLADELLKSQQANNATANSEEESTRPKLRRKIKDLDPALQFDFAPNFDLGESVHKKKAKGSPAALSATPTSKSPTPAASFDKDAETFIQGLEDRSKMFNKTDSIEDDSNQDGQTDLISTQIGQSKTKEAQVKTNPQEPLKFEAISADGSESVSSGSNAGSMLMAIIAICTAILVALFILRIIIKLWQRSRAYKKKAADAALLYSVSRAGSNKGDRPVRDERFALGVNASQNKSMAMATGMTQGQLFKFAFFIGIFLANAGRSFVLIYDVLNHSLGQSETKIRSGSVALSFTDLPTLFLMTSFSLFIYYIAQLTIQLERSRLGLFDSENQGEQRRQMLLQHNQGAHNGDIGPQNQIQMGFSDKYQKPNLLKPLFMIFNIVAYVAYLITILTYSFSKKPEDETQTNGVLTTFYRVLSGINGICFFFLTVSLLNYGSRLEKIVHAMKVKGFQQQRTHVDLQNYVGLSSGSNANQQYASGQHEHSRENADQSGPQSKALANLDVRIFCVTIFLSVVLLSISVTELLCCLKIIRDVSSMAEWKFLLYYLLSEQLPSVIIACFLSSSVLKDTFSTGKDSSPLSSPNSQSKTQTYTERPFTTHNGSRNGSKARKSEGLGLELGKMEGQQTQEEYTSEDDSEYGNFNPNRFTKSKQAQGEGDLLEMASNNLQNQSRKQLTDHSSSFSQSLLNNSQSQIAAKMDLINARNGSQYGRGGQQDRTREEGSMLLGLNDSSQYIQDRSLLGMTRNATEPALQPLNASDLGGANNLHSSKSGGSSTQNQFVFDQA